MFTFYGIEYNSIKPKEVVKTVWRRGGNKSLS